MRGTKLLHVPKSSLFVTKRDLDVSLITVIRFEK